MSQKNHQKIDVEWNKKHKSCDEWCNDHGGYIQGQTHHCLPFMYEAWLTGGGGLAGINMKKNLLWPTT